jgi:hypothetical protein
MPSVVMLNCVYQPLWEPMLVARILLVIVCQIGLQISVDTEEEDQHHKNNG